MADIDRVISTDTATVCVFDVAAMKHRMNDVGDWWSIPRNELAEVKNGNALFLNLGADGNYRIEVSNKVDPAMPGYFLNTPSGNLFIGPGEEMSGGGLEPDGMWSGFFVNVQPPRQRVSVHRTGDTIAINLQATEPFENDVTDLIYI